MRARAFADHRLNSTNPLWPAAAFMLVVVGPSIALLRWRSLVAVSVGSLRVTRSAGVAAKTAVLQDLSGSDDRTPKAAEIFARRT